MWPYMMVEVVRMPSSCAVVTTSIHWAVVMRPLRDHVAHLVVENLGRGAGERVVSRLLEARRGSAGSRRPRGWRRRGSLPARRRAGAARAAPS